MEVSKNILSVLSDIDEIAESWVNTGQIESLKNIHLSDATTLKKISMHGIKASLKKTESWQDYYYNNERKIRTVLRGKLGDMGKYMKPKKYEKFYNSDIIDGDGITFEDIKAELSHTLEKLCDLAKNSSEYLYKSKTSVNKMRDLDKDLAFQGFNNVVENYIEHLGSVVGFVEKVLDEDDVNMVAILSDRLNSRLLYDFIAMGEYIKRTTKNVN